MWRLFLRLFFTLLSIALVFLLFYSLFTVYQPVPLVAGFTGSAPALAESGLFSAEDQFKLSRLGLPDGTALSGPVVSFHNISDQLTSASGDRLLAAIVEKLQKIRPGGPNNNTAIVYLSAAGVLDTRGNACLVPSSISFGSGVGPDSQLLRVDRLLAALRAAVPSRIALVVVLDCCRPGAWPLGITDGGFAGAVESAVAEAQHERCWTILPCGPGQVSQQSALANGSALAYFFSVGLQGSADNAPFGDGDRIVDLAEFMVYLRDRIDNWALATCGERQSPAIYPALARSGSAEKITLSRKGFFWRKDRFPLVQFIFSRFENMTSGMPDAKWGAEKQAWLKERWRVADSLRAIGVHCKPYVWQEYQQLLLRMERLIQAGGNSQEIFRHSAKIELLENDLDAVRFFGFEQLPSLRLVAIGGRGSSLNGLNLNAVGWRDAIAKHVTGPDGKEPPAVIAPAASAEEWIWRAIIGWEWLTDRLGSGLVVDHAAISRWLEFLGRSPDETAPEPLEIHLTRMMVRWVEPAKWDTTAPLLGKLLRLVERSQRVRYSTDATVDACLEHMTSRLMVEKKLREALDLAIIGSPAALARSTQLAEEVSVPIENAVTLSDEAAAAFQLHETICDEIPWLAVWYANQRRAAAAKTASAFNQQEASSADLVDLETLADQLWRFRSTLSQTLRDLDSSPDGSPLAILGPLRRSREDLESRYTILKSAYLNTCDTLATSTADTPAVFASIQRVLAIPVIRGAVRGKLLQRAFTLADQFALQGSHNVVSQGEQLPSVEPMSAVAGWIRWQQMWVHPLLPFIIRDVQGSISLPTNSAELSRAMGSELEQMWQASRLFMEESKSPDGRVVVAEETAGGSTVSGDIAAIQKADASRRFAAVVGHPIENATKTPLSAWLLAWRQRLFSAAQHTLQDFWAGVEPDEPIWCTAAARAYLRAAGKLGQFTGAESVIDSWIEDAGDILKVLERIEESEGALVSVANNPKAVTVGGAADAVSGAANHTTISRLFTELPEGVGGLWLAGSANAPPLTIAEFSGERSPDRVERMSVPLSAPFPPAVVSWTASPSPFIPGLDGSSQMLDLVFWFRGHRVVRGMPVSAADTLRTVEWDQALPAQTRVAVRGDAVRNRSVAIVFDASGSMGQRLLDGRTRLESGREALYEVLDLMKQDGWNASLWVYGHRTRWTRDERGRYSAGFTPLGVKERDAVLKTGKKFLLVPGDDVEQILDMQPLSPVEVLRIRSLLDGLEPGGETPLYLAINEALRGDFAFSEPGPGHVLVVTDGANEQSGGKRTSYADVLRTLSRVNFKRISGHEVRIDVIGFNFVPGQFNREARLQELQSLATDSGGRFFDATDPTKLGASLRQSLRMMRWRVEGNGAPRESATLGSALSLPNPMNGQADSYEVILDAGPSAQRRRIGVSGGESLDLRVTGNGRGLDFQRYTGGTEQGIRDSYEDLPDPGDAKRRWFIAAHLARRELQAVRFPISIQNSSPTDFSPRPLEMWAEIRPKLPDNTLAAPYIIWDIAYQASRPVPVIDLVAPNWPSGAASAEIRAWFRFTPTPPDMVLPLSDLVPGVDRVVDIANIPGSRLRLFLSPSIEKDQVQLTVIEEHDANRAAEIPLLRVTVSPPSQRAVHSRHQNSIRVRHTFNIATVQGKIPAGAACTVTDSRRLQEGAVGIRSQIGLPAALAVPVPTE